MALTGAGRNEIFTMEDYSGQFYEDAAARLRQMGFENIARPEYVLDSKPEGMILQQNIEPSGSVSKEDEILFTVSGGAMYYTMPDFKGVSEEDVIRYFTEKNFDVEVHANPCNKEQEVYTETGENKILAKKEGKVIVERCFSPNFRAGICFEQSFEPEEKCDVDTTVTISVSVGGELKDFDVTIPDFTNMTPDKAEEHMKSSGLEEILETEFYLYYEEEDKDKENDAFYVVKQSIEAGETVNRYQDKGKKFRLEFKAE